MTEQDNLPEFARAPEFSRIIDRRGLTDHAVELTASAAECAALAERFEIVAIKALTAAVMLEAKGTEIAATGTFTADIVQSCAVSGDDFSQTISEDFTVRYVPESEWADLTVEEVELEADELDSIPYDGKTFDLGEAVAQSLALAIDPFATGPDADVVRQKVGIVGDDTPRGPLADALRALKKD